MCESVSPRSRILREAARLFAEKGYAATSVREICERAQITRPTLYYHFGSKEGLCKSMVEEARDQFLSLLERTMVGAKTAHEMIRDLISVRFEFLAENPDLSRLLFSLAFSARKEMPFLRISELSLEDYGLMRAKLVEAASRGMIRDDFIEEILCLARGAVSTAMNRFLRGEGNRPTRALAHRLARLICEGAGIQKAERGHPLEARRDR